MDFFDPDAHKAHTKRLLLGYFLLAIVVSLVTWILIYRAQGFRYDRESGFFTQQGVFYMNSQPSGAQLYLNGELFKDKTDTTTTLDQGSYTVKLIKDGYRNWERKFEIEGGTVARFEYPLLLPQTLSFGERASYSHMGVVAQSRDQQWLVLQPQAGVLLFEIRSLDRSEVVAKSFMLGVNGTTVNQETLHITWSADNSALFATYTDTAGVLHNERVLRQGDVAAVDLQSKFGLGAATVSPASSNFRHFSVYEQNGGVLRTVDADATSVSAPIASNVVAYDGYDQEFGYITTSGMTPGMMRFATYTGGNSYPIVDLPLQDPASYRVRVFSYKGDMYYLVASSDDKVARLYKNVRDFAANDSQVSPAPNAAIRFEQVSTVLVSPDSHFLTLQHDALFVTYDLETNQVYRFAFMAGEGVQQQVKDAHWLDLYRLQALVDGKLVVFDYEGSNRYDIIQAGEQLSAFLDAKLENLFIAGHDGSHWLLSQAPIKL